MTVPTRAPRQRGFTLIELLVVIGIITLLIAAFAPSLFNVFTRGESVETETRIHLLRTMCDGYERVYGAYPPHDFSTLGSGQSEWNLGTDNGKNTGIESLVMHLSWEARAGGELDQHEDWLSNTDGDKAPVTIPMLERREKVEVVDAWGTPLAYFCATSGDGFEGTQVVVAPGVDGGPGEEMTARPWKNPNSDGYLGGKRFQIISAGPDLTFNTDDDLTWPERP